MVSLGMMQGRLTPSSGRGIQFFPFDNWKNEFICGAQIGLDEIEWIFDYERYEENPLWTTKGIEDIKYLISETGVAVRSVCFDYFMRRPFYKADISEKKAVKNENLAFAERIIHAMKEIGATLIEIPMVDDSSIKTASEELDAIEFVRDVLSIAVPLGIFVGCETDMPVGTFRGFLKRIDNPNVCANYDSGNSSGLGYDHKEEIESLAELINNVHIKDRILHGTTKELGTGSADFDRVFAALKTIGYKKSIILQAARGEDGCEENNILKQIEFVKSYCKKYGIEAQ